GSHNVPHMFDSTNLHLHGLDVLPHLFEPLGTGNPLAKMIDIMPGESYDYEFRIPDDQPPGFRVSDSRRPAAGPFLVSSAPPRVDGSSGRERYGWSPHHIRRHRRSAGD